MEVVLTAAIGELASRSLSFLIDRYSRPASPNMEERLTCTEATTPSTTSETKAAMDLKKRSGTKAITTMDHVVSV
jgi:hypothetical protein